MCLMPQLQTEKILANHGYTLIIRRIAVGEVSVAGAGIICLLSVAYTKFVILSLNDSCQPLTLNTKIDLSTTWNDARPQKTILRQKRPKKPLFIKRLQG